MSQIVALDMKFDPNSALPPFPLPDNSNLATPPTAFSGPAKSLAQRLDEQYRKQRNEQPVSTPEKENVPFMDELKDFLQKIAQNGLPACFQRSQLRAFSYLSTKYQIPVGQRIKFNSSKNRLLRSLLGNSPAPNWVKKRPQTSNNFKKVRELIHSVRRENRPDRVTSGFSSTHRAPYIPRRQSSVSPSDAENFNKKLQEIQDQLEQERAERRRTQEQLDELIRRQSGAFSRAQTPFQGAENIETDFKIRFQDQVKIREIETTLRRERRQLELNQQAMAQLLAKDQEIERLRKQGTNKRMVKMEIVEAEVIQLD